MGYVFTDNGFGKFKLPVILVDMLLPLILLGPAVCRLTTGCVAVCSATRRRTRRLPSAPLNGR